MRIFNLILLIILICFIGGCGNTENKNCYYLVKDKLGETLKCNDTTYWGGQTQAHNCNDSFEHYNIESDKFVCD